MSDPIQLAREGAVAYLTLNRPELGNAIDVPMAKALLGAVVACDIDPSVRCVVVRGNGRMFCAGGDVVRLHAAGDGLPALLKEITAYLHGAIIRLARMEKPVITAIHGAAAGAGVGLAAIGDIALAEPAAHFTLAYSRIGLSPDAGATWLLPRLIGMRRAQEMALTNRRISAAEAAAMGLITRVVPEGALTGEVSRLVESLATAAVAALGKTRQLLLDGADTGLEAQLEAESRAIAAQSASDESHAGLAAFIGRRQPVFVR